MLQHGVRQALTLFELLVVITIVAVLVSALMPLAGVLRASAKQVACHQQLRDLNLGLLGFAADNRGQLMGASGGNVWRWFHEIGQYNDRFSGDFMPACPAYRGVLTWSHPHAQWDARGYALNAIPLSPDDWTHSIVDWRVWWSNNTATNPRHSDYAVKMARVTRPSERYLVADADYFVLFGPRWLDDWKGDLVAGSMLAPTVWGFEFPQQPVQARHRQQRNVLMFDGSSRAVPLHNTEWLAAR